MVRVDVKPTLLRWARERSGVAATRLRRRFPRLDEWERGISKPTFKQFEALAKALFVPIGYLFLDEPPTESVPLPDFRSGHAREFSRPSPNLLDTVYACQQRQAWYREYARSMGEGAKPFVGSLAITTPVEAAASTIRSWLRFDLDARRDCPTWTEALRHFISQADEQGVLVMCSGVVFNNTQRKLDPAEFRGFAIADPVAPLVFINGADTKAAQMFTLAHELCHLWLGQSALTDADVRGTSQNVVERWCNDVTAELLVPRTVIEREFRRETEPFVEMSRLARRFKVSTLVALRRIYDIGGLSWNEFRERYVEEVDRLSNLPRTSGGDFYLTLPIRVSKRFAAALVESTLEGHTLYRDAFRMLGISKVETFNQIGRTLQPAE